MNAQRLGVVALVLGLAAVAYWMPREDEVTAGDEAAVGGAARAGAPPAVELRATPLPHEASDAERWELAYPFEPPARLRLTLAIGPRTGTAAAARLTAAPGGNPAAFLDRVGVILDAGGAPPPPQPAVGALDLRLDAIGERLSIEPGDTGATLVAGVFTSEPAGDWRAWRVTIGAEGGPQFFLGMSDRAHAAVFLPASLADGPEIQRAFRALLLSRPAATS